MWVKFHHLIVKFNFGISECTQSHSKRWRIWKCQLGYQISLRCRVTIILWVEAALIHWGWHKLAAIFQTSFWKRIFINKNILILFKISMKFLPMGSINNIPALVQIMAWCRTGDKPLFEPMLMRLLTNKCVTRPQWVKDGKGLLPTRPVSMESLYYIFTLTSYFTESMVWMLLTWWRNEQMPTVSLFV